MDDTSAASDRLLLTGVQAIGRQLVEQNRRDARAGKRVATFVSGYQGSPLAGVDKMLAGMPEVLARHDITFVPGVNEELAATSVWGSQARPRAGDSRYDGVVGVWYGKCPGVDRATDALRHANTYGVDPHGGMIVYAGDDPGSKSSSLPAVSDRSLAALGIPVLYPRNAAEIVSLGIHAVAMSRSSGCVVAMKIVTDVAAGSWTVPPDVGEVDVRIPEIDWEGKPFRYVQRVLAAPTDSVIAERDLLGPRWEMVKAYGEVNELDDIEIDPPTATVGLIAAGATFDATRQALTDLGLDDDVLSRNGIRLLRIGMPYPLSESRIREFARGLDRIVVVEDKSAFIETQVRDILYVADHRPHVLGKRDAQGRPLVPSDGELTAQRLTGPLRRALRDRVDLPPPAPLAPLSISPIRRIPYFCSGCSHNRSTVLPDGSIGAGGIGCHTLVTVSGRDADTVTQLTQMGGEGAQWIGQAPFTDTPHIFQNIGDGTFFHSGVLAVRACVAAGVNITYKLLYNDVVAMTGAQEPVGALSVPALTRLLFTEGVAEVIVLADEPRYPGSALAPKARLWSRDRLDEAQRHLRTVPGVTVLVYDQHCAADARRLRARGDLRPRDERVIINESVCDGCGDCGVKSNCLSVQPVDTEFGVKSRIDQSSCNIDLSCLDGDCPAFATVRVDPRTSRRAHPEPPLVEPPPRVATGSQDIFLAGIGGTGIVTITRILGMAATATGHHVAGFDQLGMSQKAGSVVSHLRIGERESPRANRVPTRGAHCFLAFDLLTATETDNLAYGDPDRTVTVASTSRTPTGDMIGDRTLPYPADELLVERIRSVSHSTILVDSAGAARKLFGDSASANMLLVGAAYQAGAVRLSRDAIEDAIRANGVEVDIMTAAFRWGRVAVARPDLFAAAVTPRPRASVTMPPELRCPDTFDAELARVTTIRAVELAAYQDLDLARRYLATVEVAWRAERAVTERTEFSTAVARELFTLSAYKDEYEVARLLTAPSFLAEVDDQLPGSAKPTYLLHPPILRALGRTRKIGLAPRWHWVLRLLARGKRLRGTVFDPFGYTAMRRLERALVQHFVHMTRTLAAGLDTDNYETAVRATMAAGLVRGYESVKIANVRRYEDALDLLGIPGPSDRESEGHRLDTTAADQVKPAP